MIYNSLLAIAIGSILGAALPQAYGDNDVPSAATSQDNRDRANDQRDIKRDQAHIRADEKDLQRDRADLRADRQDLPDIPCGPGDRRRATWR